MTVIARPRHRAPAFIALIRGLQVFAGFVTMYGSTGMSTSAGFRTPNAIVYLGLALAALAAVGQRSVGARWLDGWWAFAGAFSVALGMVLLRTLGAPECASGHEFTSGETFCVSAGSHAAFVVAALVATGSMIGGLRAWGRDR